MRARTIPAVAALLFVLNPLARVVVVAHHSFAIDMDKEVT